jgi:hypothetical protein
MKSEWIHPKASQEEQQNKETCEAGTRVQYVFSAAHYHKPYNFS